MTQETKVGENNEVDLDRVEAIRAATSDTRERVRAIATYLFLECGIYPSAAKVLELSKRGSMVTITSELTSWWQSIRDRMRPALVAPDIPESLRTKLAEFGTELWIGANNEARAVFELDRARLESQAESAARQAEDARLATEALKQELAAAHQDKHDLHARLGQREDALIEAQKSVQMLQNEVERRTAENRETQDRLAIAQQEFAKQLDNQRGVIAKIEQRAEDEQRRQLLEIDRARQESLRKGEELAKLKEQSERAAEAARRAQAQASKTQADMQQRITQLTAERALQEATAQATIQGLQAQLEATNSMAAANQRTLEAAEAREKSLNEELRALRTTLDRVLNERNAPAADTKADGVPPASA